MGVRPGSSAAADSETHGDLLSECTGSMSWLLYNAVQRYKELTIVLVRGTVLYSAL